eukprot:CAMPEP_0182908214 /NCGR_PEP_ID=MMETSP0034_2-20130328/35081_1 /TAXON_ID=156128 /ORGANISM="Nephroselmis pyriformis, Strain CCMP717" /LENGTH=102 /DNA_ID=CAMNT_0025044375 /DNA_START=144 /DNA_END=452 /DNA_ORIENTATION=-
MAAAVAGPPTAALDATSSALRGDPSPQHMARGHHHRGVGAELDENEGDQPAAPAQGFEPGSLHPNRGKEKEHQRAALASAPAKAPRPAARAPAAAAAWGGED